MRVQGVELYHMGQQAVMGMRLVAHDFDAVIIDVHSMACKQQVASGTEIRNRSSSNDHVFNPTTHKVVLDKDHVLVLANPLEEPFGGLFSGPVTMQPSDVYDPSKQHMKG